MYGRDAYGQVPWAGGILPPANVGQLPPPIPGDDATFSYTTVQVARPWAYLSWAGGYPRTSYPGGGILAHPDPAAGVVRLQVWWPDAPLLHLVRITPDGTHTPVRGAYPLAVTAATRRNRCQNPSIEAGLNGLVPDAGNPTLTRVVDPTAPAGTAILRATNASAGSNGVTLPATLTGLVPASTTTIGFALRTSATAATVTVSIAWVDGVGTPLATTSTTLTADERTLATNQFLRVVRRMTVPANAANGTLKVIATGMPAAGRVDLDAITVDGADTDGSYVDGNQVGGIWLGTSDLSTSVVAPVQLVLDAECPLDTLVTYELAYQAITGGRVTSTPPVLLTGDGGSWLTHPARPDQPLKVVLATVPTLERTIPQGVFLPVGARWPVVVSAMRRQAPVTTLEFVTLSFDDRDVLLEAFADSSPVLLRFPREYGYPAPLWLAVGRVTEDRGDRKAFHDSVILAAEVTEVAAPALA